MSRSDARTRDKVVVFKDCARCGSMVNVEALLVSPAGDDACWPCLRPEERTAIMKEI